MRREDSAAARVGSGGGAAANRGPTTAAAIGGGRVGDGVGTGKNNVRTTSLKRDSPNQTLTQEHEKRQRCQP